VDLPAVSPEHPVPWLASTLQTADAALLVVDLGDPACLEQVETVRTILRERRVTLTDRWEAADESSGGAAEGDEDPFALRLRTLLVANKVECLADAAAELRAFLDVTGLGYPALTVSAATGQGLGKIGPWLFSIHWVDRSSSRSVRIDRDGADGQGHPWSRSRSTARQ